jgi:hypothetical protein
MIKNFSKKKGITAVEILITMAILIIILSVTIAEFAKIKERQSLDNGVTDIVFALHKASSNTLASIDSSEYGVHFEFDRVIIFKGIVFSEMAPENQIINIAEPAIISDISFSPDVVDVYFNRLSNTPSETGTVTITTGLISKTVSIDATGTISVN